MQTLRNGIKRSPFVYLFYIISTQTVCFLAIVLSSYKYLYVFAIASLIPVYIALAYRSTTQHPKYIQLQNTV